MTLRSKQEGHVFFDQLTALDFSEPKNEAKQQAEAERKKREETRKAIRSTFLQAGGNYAITSKRLGVPVEELVLIVGPICTQHKKRKQHNNY